MNDSRSHAQPGGTLGAIDALSDILSGVKRDIARSREVLNGAFGKIAARFAQVHAIAVAAEARQHRLSDEALAALRKVTDGLTIEQNGRCACPFHNRERHRRKEPPPE